MFGRKSSPSRGATSAPRAPPKAAPQKSGGLLGGGGGLGSTMMSGMAFGAGSAVAHQAIGGLMGGRGGGENAGAAPQEGAQGGMTQEGYANAPEGFSDQAQAYENPCMTYNQTLLQCLQTNNGEIGICQNDMNMVVQCERDNANIV